MRGKAALNWERAYFEKAKEIFEDNLNRVLVA